LLIAIFYGKIYLTNLNKQKMSKLTILSFISAVICLLVISLANPVLAAVDCDNLPPLSELAPAEQAEAALCPVIGNDTETTTVPEIIQIIIGILSWVIGIASVIVILVQGLRLILSGGNSQTATEARNGIIYALVGLAVAISAAILVRYIVDQL